MTQSNDPAGQRWRRRLVLGIALALALAVGLPRSAAPVDAAPATEVVAAPEASAPAQGDTSAPAKADAGRSAAKRGSHDADEADVTVSSRGIVVGKGGHGVSVRGMGSDREYDSFEEFVNDAPWLAAIVFLAVLMVFLMPLLIVVLFIWYKLRKTRMQNEAMLKLAEKGVVAPAEAMSSIVATPGAMQNVPPSAVPLYEQARQLRKRAAWSDLRKGVVLLAVGLGLTFFSMLDDGTPNSIGLICLFLGIGYGALWFFEERQAAPAKRDAGAPPTSSA
jgi:hypothetical protein